MITRFCRWWLGDELRLERARAYSDGARQRAAETEAVREEMHQREAAWDRVFQANMGRSLYQIEQAQMHLFLRHVVPVRPEQQLENLREHVEGRGAPQFAPFECDIHGVVDPVCRRCYSEGQAIAERMLGR